jgi:hypothetical protein
LVSQQNLTNTAFFEGRYSRIPSPFIRVVPRIGQVLHEARVPLTRPVLAHLLDDKVTACAADVGQIDEIVTTEPILREFGLLADAAVVDGDDGAGRAIGGFDGRFAVGGDVNVLVVVPAVDLEELVLVGHVADEDSVRHFG